MIIINKQPRNISVAGILLRPGANIIEEHDSKVIKDAQEVADKFKQTGIIDWLNNHPQLEVEADDSSDEDTIDSIADVDSEDAIGLITDTWDYSALERLLAQENDCESPRKEVIKAVEKQLDSVKKRMKSSQNTGE